MTQRLWWALLLTVGFWGLLRLAEALGIGSPGSRVIAAAAFALSPRVLTTIGAISSETLPMMLAPWVLLPVILALRGAGSVRVLAARSALALALMGAVNAVATLTGCLAALIWWACHRPNRLWLRFTAWWALCSVLAIAWWVVALVMLGRISPPFLDFIESSGVTTQWTSLTEMLRGTDSWTPFVAPNATAGASLVTGSVAVLATTLVAAAGLAGLAMRTMPARGRLVTMLLIGIVLLAAGYSGGLGSPLAHEVQAFLDATGTPLRNVHKLEPVIRLPLVLGLAHLLGRIPLPGSAPRREWMRAFAHPENDKRVAVGIVVLVALATGTSLAWTGRLTPPGAFDAIPPVLAPDRRLARRAQRRARRPGACWWCPARRSPRRCGEPATTSRCRCSATARGVCATRSRSRRRRRSAHLIRCSGCSPPDDRPRGSRIPLRGRAFHMSWSATTSTPRHPGRHGRCWCTGRSTDRPACRRWRSSANRSDPARWRVSSPTAGCGRSTRRWRSTGLTTRSANPARPYLTDTDAMARVDGGPEALLRLDERRRLLDQPPLGPMLLTADAQRAGLPTPVVTVTDTPLARETDYGRVDDHSSAIRAAGDTRHTFNRVPDYPAGDTRMVHGDWTGGRISVSSSAADSTALPNVAPATGPTAAIDSDSSTSWVSNALQSAVGQWLQVDFDHPVTNATITVTPSATAVGAQVRRIEISTVNGTSTLRFDEAGKPLTAALPYGETPWVRITAVGTDDGSPGVQFGITDFTVTQYDASGFAQPIELRHTVVVPGPPPNSAVAQWDLGSELLGRSGCAEGPDGVHCAAAMALSPEEPVNLSRTLTVR